MTTVVASVKLGGMSADQRVTGEGAIAHIKKIHRINGSLYGIAGAVNPAMLFLQWLGGRKRTLQALHKMIEAEHRDDFTVLELSGEGLALWSGWGARVPILDLDYGIGSGATVALSHLRKGESLEAAIHAALPIDECTGIIDEPQVEYLVPGEWEEAWRR